MNKNEFIKLINLLIDKKLKKILPGLVENEVKKYMESGIEPDIDDFENDGDIKNLLHHTNASNPVLRDNNDSKKKQTESKNWSKNPIINNILNETAKNFTTLKKDPTDTAYSNFQQMLESEYKDVGEEFSFNTKNMSNLINRNVQPSNATENNLKQKVMQDGADPQIANAMVKNYSGMLKKMDKVAKSKRNGGMPLKGIGE